MWRVALWGFFQIWGNAVEKAKVSERKTRVHKSLEGQAMHASENGHTSESDSAAHDGPMDRIFQDPTIQQTVAEDPIARWFNENWRTFVTLAVIAIAIVYGRNVFRETHQANMQRAADVFVRLQSEYQSFVQDLDSQDTLVGEQGEKSGEETEDGAKASKRQEKVDFLLSLVRALGEEQDPYKTLGKQYEVLLRLKLGQYDQAKQAAQSLGALADSDGIEKVDERRLATEMSLLALARYEIDTSELKGEGLKRLESLVKNGAVASLSAALAFAAVSEDKERALSLLEALAERQPEHAELLETEINRLRQ